MAALANFLLLGEDGLLQEGAVSVAQRVPALDRYALCRQELPQPGLLEVRVELGLEDDRPDLADGKDFADLLFIEVGEARHGPCPPCRPSPCACRVVLAGQGEEVYTVVPDVRGFGCCLPLFTPRRQALKPASSVLRHALLSAPWRPLSFS